MSQLGDLVACFEDALPNEVKCVCVSETHAAAACAQSIFVYEIDARSASGTPSLQRSLTLSPPSPAQIIRAIDSSCLASADGSDVICVWALRNWHLPATAALPPSLVLAGTCAAMLAGHGGGVTCLAVAAGKKMFSASGDGAIFCWSIHGFERAFQMKSSLGVSALCCSGSVVCSADASKIVRIWSADSGNCLKEISVGRDVGGLCCNASTLFVSVPRQICIPYNLSTFASDMQFSLPTPADGESALTHMSSYGSVVTALSDGRVLALTAGGHMEPFHLDRIPVTCLDTASGFVIISHSANNAVCIFFIEPFMTELTNQLQSSQADYFESFRIAHSKLASSNKSVDVQVTSTGNSLISSVVNVSGIFYVGHADGSLQCFQTFSSGKSKRLFSCQAHEDVVACAAILRLKTVDAIATGSGDGSVKLWGQSDGQLLGEIEIGLCVSCMCIHQGHIMIGLEDGTLLQMEIDNKLRLKVIGEMRGHVQNILALRSDTKHIISSSRDGTVRVWVPAQQRCIQVLEPFQCTTTALNWHQSSLFLGGQQGQLAAFSTTTWQNIGAYDEAHTKSITLLEIFKGTFIITGTSDGCVSIWTFDLEEAFSSGHVLKDAVLHAELIKGKGAPQLWLVGTGGQIVCVHSPELSSIILRADGGGQKPDVTSFFDGMISLLPISHVPGITSSKDHFHKKASVRLASSADSNLNHNHIHPVVVGLNKRPSGQIAATMQSTIPDTDIKRLKQVLDTINTTKTASKITLTHQERLWRKAFDFFDTNKDGTISASELGKLLTLLHRNTSASSITALMQQFDLNHNNIIDFPEFVLLMQSLPESDESILESVVEADFEIQTSNSRKQIESHSALTSVSTQAQLLSIAASHSTVIAGSRTGLIFIWDLEEDCLFDVGTLGAVQQTHVSFVSRTQFASGSSDGIITLWNLTSRRSIYEHQLPGPVSVLIAWRNFLFVGGGSAVVNVLDWRTFDIIGNLQGHSDIVHLADKFLSTRILVTASLDKCMRLWSIPRFICSRTLLFDSFIIALSTSEQAPGAAIASSNSLFALFEDNTVRRIDVESGSTLVRWQISKDISPAFISVFKESVFVAWRDSEVMEVLSASGKKLSKFIGLYGVPEAAALSSGVLYCCCSSGTICAWGTRYLGDTELNSGTEHITIWDHDAQITADVLSANLTMRFPITNFIRNKQHQISTTEQDSQNLKDSLRRYLGVATKKNTSKSRPHPILSKTTTFTSLASNSIGILSPNSNISHSTLPKSSSPSHTPNSLTSQDLDIVERSKQIRQLWLGPLDRREEILSRENDTIAISMSPVATSTASDYSSQPIKMLQACDFVSSRTADPKPPSDDMSMQSLQPLSVESGLSTQKSYFPASSSAEIPATRFDATITSANKGNKTSTVLLSTPPTLSVPRSEVQVKSSVVAPSIQVRRNDHDRTAEIGGSIIGRAQTVLKELPAENDKKQRSPESDVINGAAENESVITWTHISNAWGAKPKRGDETKLISKSTS